MPSDAAKWPRPCNTTCPTCGGPVTVDETAMHLGETNFYIPRFSACDADTLIETIESLLGYIPEKCDEGVTPAWCCNHQMKRCKGAEVVARAKQVIAQLRPGGQR